MESLDRLTEAWKNRLLKAPNQTKLLSYGKLLINYDSSELPFTEINSNLQ